MKRKTIFLILILLFSGITFLGCFSRHIMGTPISENKLYGIQIGKTTRAQVFELFGTPFKIENENDGQSLIYVYAESLSTVTGVYNERRDKADILNILINSDGVVSSYSFSKGVPIPEGLDPMIQSLP